MTKSARALLACVFFALLFAADEGVAQDIYVPPELEPWREWVLQGQEARLCPKVPSVERNVCSWPGQLDIVVNGEGATFSQTWDVVQRDDWIALPGNRRQWPENVTIDGRDAIVVWRDNAPAIRASVGRHSVAGRFRWQRRPQELPIPARVALLTLQVDGAPVGQIRRGDRGLWLGDPPETATVRSSLTSEVHRLVQDGSPTRLTTLIRIDVSGAVREVRLGPALPAEFVPEALTSELPARLEADNHLRLQVRPGSWEITLVSRAPSVAGEIARPANQSQWADTEIWSFAANNALRVSIPTAAVPVDPLQTNVPVEWRDYPAFAIEPGESLTIEERRRGEVDSNNQLRLSRSLWLDFDGGGYTVSDTLTGAMRKGWRLSMREPYQLLSAEETAASDNLLVTTHRGDAAGGIEVRTPQLGVKALSRTETTSPLPVSGWDQAFDGVVMQVHLPPAHRLVAAPGADVAGGAWLNRWRLLDMFLVLFITVSAGKLFGRGVGTLTLVAMVLGAHETGAPSWAWLNLFAGIALFRVAPEGKLRFAAKWYRNGSALVLVALLVPFFANQLKLAMYPQLDVGVQSSAPRDFPAAPMPVDLPLAEEAQFESDAMPASKTKLEQVTVSGSAIQRRYNRYAPDALVQTGPGIPQWQWINYRLSWTGPVEPEREFRPVVAPPWLVSTWRVVLVGSLALLALLIARSSFPGVGNLRWRATEASGTAAACLFAALLAGTATETRAETPSPELLEELQRRLLAAPECQPRCGEVLRADVRATDQSLAVSLLVNALEPYAIQLPGSESSWLPTRITVDDRPAAGVYRDDDGAYWLVIDGGRHLVRLQGTLPTTATLTVPFGTKPRVVDVTADGWQVGGVADRRLVSGALELTRVGDSGESVDASQWETTRFPTFLTVRRKLAFDIDWFVETTVQRVAPEDGAVSARIPLLRGESVVTESTVVEEGEVLLSLAANQDVARWESTLDRQTPIELAAPESAGWTEVWTLGASNIWHIDVDGVPASQRDYRTVETWEPVFHPRPGETLIVQLTRPEALAGNTLAFDEARLRSDVGDRTTSSNLQFRYRSTRGTQQPIALPPNAEVTTILVDNEPLPLQAENGEVRLPIRPGSHTVTLVFTEPVGSGLRTISPRLNLGNALGNVHVELNMPRNRWILATSGDGVGPAVLYWSELVALGLLALLLARIPWTPLRWWHWLLLGLGFSTFSWFALALVAAWLVALGWRSRGIPTQSRWVFNLTQVALGGFSVIALASLLVSVPFGLLGTPDMHVTGNGSSNYFLRWFIDRSDGVVPSVSAVSVPLWIYKVAILAWALWLSFALIRWLPWAWKCFSADGLWRARTRVAQPQDAPPAG